MHSAALWTVNHWSSLIGFSCAVIYTRRLGYSSHLLPFFESFSDAHPLVNLLALSYIELLYPLICSNSNEIWGHDSDFGLLSICS